MVSFKIIYRVCLLSLITFLITFGLSIAGITMEQKSIRVCLQRSGGFTGIPITTVVDTASLPSAAAEQLRQLIESADFLHLPPVITAGNALPDRFQYHIAIEDDEQKHSVTVGEAAISDKLKTLIDFVVKIGYRK
jgi:hypothetical protein